MTEHIEIRRVTEEERPAYGRAVWTGFGEQASEEAVEAEGRFASAGPAIAAFDAGRIVGTMMWFSTALTMPGGRDLPVSALTEVTVHPTHRRRGIMRRMMEVMFADIAGTPASVLTASEGTIYGRFGYGIATRKADVTVASDRAALIDGDAPAAGWRLASREVAEPHLVRLHERHRRRGAGDIRRPPAWWRWELDDVEGRAGGDPPRFFALRADRRGRIDAAVAYRISGGGPGVYPDLRVDDVLAADDHAEREAWRYLLGVDLIHEVRWPGPLDPVVAHLVADPLHVRLDRMRFGLWLRPLDVPAVLGARAYAATGQVVLQVNDPAMPAVGGRFALSAGPDGAECIRTRASADLALDVQALAAVVLGGTGVEALVRAGRITEKRAGAARRAGALFATGALPFLASGF
ncbi:MAG: GNAT family N-acetyltransferase [Thermoleophilia bacterium]|nr:GNAT family N-acetyltransferase [Thermoleophilia bacterium]